MKTRELDVLFDRLGPALPLVRDGADLDDFRTDA